MTLAELPWKRFLLMWGIAFLVLYVTSLALYTFQLATGNIFLSLLIVVFAPAWTLFMAWKYFEQVTPNDWASRFLTALIWVALYIVLSAALLPFVYGYSWTVGFSSGALTGQSMNFIAVLVGGYVATKPKEEKMPEGPGM